MVLFPGQGRRDTAEGISVAWHQVRWRRRRWRRRHSDGDGDDDDDDDDDDETTTTTGECSVYNSLFSTCVYTWLPVLVAGSFAPCKSANMEQAYSHANMQTWKKLTARWNRRCQNENLDMRSFSPICKQQDVIATD